MKCDESKCVNCQRCVSLCPTRALKIVKSDCTLRDNNWFTTGRRPYVFGIWLHGSDGSLFTGNKYLVVFFPDDHRTQLQPIVQRYDANRRFIEMFGYKCTLQTDTEVITYIMDYLLRVQGLTLEIPTSSGKPTALKVPMFFPLEKT